MDIELSVGFGLGMLFANTLIGKFQHKMNWRNAILFGIFAGCVGFGLSVFIRSIRP